MTAFTRPAAHRVYGPTFATRLDLMGIRFMADDGDDGAGELTAEEIAALGDPGKQAIDRMKGKVTATKAELKAFSDLGMTPAEIKTILDERNKQSAGGAGNESVDEAAIEKRVRDSIESEVTARDEARARRAEVRAQAAGLNFIKPLEALALIDSTKLADIKVDPKTGEADAAAVKTLLEQLATDSPHLLKPKDDTPDHHQVGIGASGTGSAPAVQPGTPRLAGAYANNSKK